MLIPHEEIIETLDMLISTDTSLMKSYAEQYKFLEAARLDANITAYRAIKFHIREKVKAMVAADNVPGFTSLADEFTKGETINKKV